MMGRKNSTDDPSDNEDTAKIPVYTDVVFPYLKSSSVFHCPSDVQKTLDGTNPVLSDNAFEKYGTSYSYLLAAQIISKSDADAAYYQLLLANPSKAPLCRDTGTWHGMVPTSGYDNYRQVVYLDLHVKKMRLQQMIDESEEILKSGQSN